MFYVLKTKLSKTLDFIGTFSNLHLDIETTDKRGDDATFLVSPVTLEK